MKSIITGGIGFIGSSLAERLKDSIIIDNINPYYSIKLKNYNKNLILRNGNIFLKKSIKNYNFEEDNFDYIFHLAAQAGVRYSIDHPKEVFNINLMETIEFLEKIRINKIKIKKFIFLSSSSVFGNIEYLPIDEKHPKNPISPYGVSKLAAESYVKNYCIHYGIPIVILRPFTVVGKRQRPDMGLHRFIHSIINDKPVVIYGDGSQTRDWTHVENIIQGILLAAEKEEAVGEDFNLGNGSRISVNDVLERISNFLNKDYKVEQKPRNIADPKDTQADISKAKEILGYKPKKSLDEAIIEQINFYISHEELYD